MSAALVAMTVSVLSLLVVRPWLVRTGVIDTPTARSSHTVPTVRGLGVGPLLGILVGLGYYGSAAEDLNSALLPLMAITFAFGILGFIEDVRGLPILWRAIGQLTIGTLFGVTIWIEGSWNVLVVPFFALLSVGIVNVTNFLDGVNNMSVFHAVIFGLAFSVIGAIKLGPVWMIPIGMIIAASFASFFPFNFRGRAFLGDSGSYALGGIVVGVIGFAVSAGAPAFAVVAPLGIYLTDATVTLVRRVYNRERWYLSHRSHIYHQLEDLGWSHTLVATFTSLLSSMCAILGILATTANSIWMAALVMVPIALYIASPALFGARQPR